MAKRKTVEAIVFCKDDKLLALHTSFVYNIEIFKLIPGRYNLEDSMTISSKDIISCNTQVFYKKDVRFIKYTKLVAAPLVWLNQNKFKQIKPLENE